MAARRLNPNDFKGGTLKQPIGLYVLENAQKMRVAVCNYGARIVQIATPGTNGVLQDRALGFDHLAALQAPAPNGVPSMGAFIGRFANRIAQGQFEINGVRYDLPKNAGAHTIHGGPQGTRQAVFEVLDSKPQSLVLAHRFRSNLDGFPGDLDLLLTYALSDDHELSIAWQALALNHDTHANFTSHVFFNLSGDLQSNVGAHTLQLHAASYLKQDDQGIPSGELCSVSGTPLDFQVGKPLGQDWDSKQAQMAQCQGYDHYFVLGPNHPPGTAQARFAGRLSDPASGRSVTVSTTEPGLQLYTANHLDGASCGFRRRTGVCLEPSYYPDAPNHGHFPSTLILAGQTRSGQINYAFT